jgi:DNA-binding MarR family transcriptional regulator
MEYDFHHPYRGRLFVYGGYRVCEPETRLGYWLRGAARQLAENLAGELDEWDLTITESRVLQELYRPGRSNPLAVAQVLEVSKAAASKSIARLVGKRLVKRTFVSADRRSRGVELTSLGKMIVPALAQLEDVTEREFFSVLSRKERRDLIVVLRLLDRMGRPRPTIWEHPTAKVRRVRGLGASAWRRRNMPGWS